MRIHFLGKESYGVDMGWGRWPRRGYHQNVPVYHAGWRPALRRHPFLVAQRMNAEWSKDEIMHQE